MKCGSNEKCTYCNKGICDKYTCDNQLGAKKCGCDETSVDILIAAPVKIPKCRCETKHNRFDNCQTDGTCGPLNCAGE